MVPNEESRTIPAGRFGETVNPLVGPPVLVTVTSDMAEPTVPAIETELIVIFGWLHVEVTVEFANG